MILKGPLLLYVLRSQGRNHLRSILPLGELIARISKQLLDFKSFETLLFEKEVSESQESGKGAQWGQARARIIRLRFGAAKSPLFVPFFL